MVLPALVQPDFVAQLKTGLGTGAIGTALIGMLGGYALSGRGPRWARIASRAACAALILATIVGTAVSTPELRSTNAFLAITLLALLSLLAAACTLPHLPIALRLENTDTMVHSFDIDAFDVHVAMPTGTAALALFTATAPGSYPFYCRIPGHTEAGMAGTLIIEP